MIHLSTQHKLSVLQRLIVEQPVQFRPLYRGVSVFVLHSGAIDGNGGATLEPGFHPVGVHIESAGKQFVHGEPHFYVNGVCSDVLNPAKEPVCHVRLLSG